MPDQQHLIPDSMPKPAGFTQVVKVDKTVYIAGQVSKTADGTVVGIGDPDEQVRQTWRNLEAAIKSVGGSIRNIVKTTTYVTDIGLISSTRKVRAEFFQGLNPPTGTLVEVSRLATPECMVEIEAIAVLD